MESDDEFILHGLAKREERDKLNFTKDKNSTHLVMKHVRYLQIINNLLNKIPNLKVIGIVRHPCATINSWINCKNEFSEQWIDTDEWFHAEKKNKDRVEEFFGFKKWMEAMIIFEKIIKKHPEKFYLQSYSKLLDNPENEIVKLFKFINLKYNKQTLEFIQNSRLSAGRSDYSVFRLKKNDRAWENELSPLIRKIIKDSLVGTKFEKYLYQ